MEIGVTEAAKRLKLDESRVRTLLRSGELAGRRVGRLWLADGRDVARLASQHSLSGRPLGPRRAWGVLDLLDGGSAAWLSYSARSRTRASLRNLSGADADRWRWALRGRSQILRCQAHPATLRRLAQRTDVLLAGPAEAARRGADLTGLDEEVMQIYLRAEDWGGWSRSLLIRTVPYGGNLLVRFPREVWAFAGNDRVGMATLAADLLEEAEPRCVTGGHTLLTELAQRAVT